MIPRSRALRPYFLLAALLLPACSGDGGTGLKELKPLVGAWRARSLVMTSKANPALSQDLVKLGATFTLSVLATGQYSASLSAFGVTNVEVGTIKVSGNQVIITPTSPPGEPLTGTWWFQGEILFLEGDSTYDINQDGTPDAVVARFELERFG